MAAAVGSAGVEVQDGQGNFQATSVKMVTGALFLQAPCMLCQDCCRSTCAGLSTEAGRLLPGSSDYLIDLDAPGVAPGFMPNGLPVRLPLIAAVINCCCAVIHAPFCSHACKPSKPAELPWGLVRDALHSTWQGFTLGRNLPLRAVCAPGNKPHAGLQDQDPHAFWQHLGRP